VLACLMHANMKHMLAAVDTSRGRVLLRQRWLQARDAATSCCQIHPRSGLCNDPRCKSGL
jgi:hypothetical protein